MIKFNFIEVNNTYSNLNAVPLSDQTKLEINKIKDYFNSEIQERKTMSKKINTYTLLIFIILTRL